MNLLTQPVGLSHYLVVGAILFVCGVVCMATKRNAAGRADGHRTGAQRGQPELRGLRQPACFAPARQIRWGWTARLIALFVIVLAAAEAAVALAIALNYYHTHATIDVDRGE